jgi:hypothetical protein
MALDYCVAFACNPKQFFGKGDCIQGSVDILERLKAKDRGAMLAQMARQDGQDPYAVSLKLCLSDQATHPAPQFVTLRQLEEHALPLQQLAPACEGCPARCFDTAYGCFGCINYPISSEAEDWLLSRLQASGPVGAALCLDYMADFAISGAPIARMRQSGLLAAPRARRVTLNTGLFGSKSVTADQLLESLFLVGNPLDPGHCFGVLIWLGAIAVDGRVPVSPTDRGRIQKLASLTTPDTRARSAQLDLGPDAH